MKKITLILFKFLNEFLYLNFFKYKFNLNKIKLINQSDKRVQIINNKIICNFSDVKYENLLILADIELDIGLYNLKFKTNIFSGKLNLGILDEVASKWIYNFDLDNKNSSNFALSEKKKLKLIITSNNEFRSDNNFELSNLKLRKIGGKKKAQKFINNIEEDIKYNKFKINVEPKNLISALEKNIGKKDLYLNGKINLLSIDKIGYASRCIAATNYKDLNLLFATNTGDNSISLIIKKKNSIIKKFVLQLPKFTNPIGLEIIQENINDLPKICICVFKMERHTQTILETGVYIYNLKYLLNKLESIDQININENDLIKIYSREGYCGARSLKIFNKQNSYYFIICDRDFDKLVIVKAKKKSFNIENFYEYKFNRFFEPIGLEFLLSGDMGLNIYVTSRKNKELIHLFFNFKNFKVINKINLPFQTRSQISIGNISNEKFLAIGLWGGEITNFDSHNGYLQIFKLDRSFNIILNESHLIPSGTNTTDVIFFDFDSDGDDEVFSLNYGNGINILKRDNFGDVSVFKFNQDSFKKVGTIKIPSPRISYVGDFDGDKFNEIGFTLFYEKRLCIFKNVKNIAL